MKSSARWLFGLPLLALFSSLPDSASATGGWVPERFLDEGGARLKAAPVFYWDIEVTRLAKQYAEKEPPAKFPEDPFLSPAEEGKASGTAIADNSDFEDAVKFGKFKPVDLAAARAAQAEMRSWLQNGASDENRPKLIEADSEFADYHKGAALLADDKPEDAKAAWEKLLQRPADQRHYRSVWAAYMLGKTCMKDEKTRNDAIAWFVKCRQLAREGFADSLFLAADSYGWQARAEYDAGNHPASARHYLQQLALGDTSAVASLKLLVPDRSLMDTLGELSFASLSEQSAEPDPNAPAPDDALVEAKRKAAREAADKALAVAAKDEVLRQLVTAHILCAGTSYTYEDHSRGTRWLDMIGKSNLDHVEGAASLGWAAYDVGRYADAEKWLRFDKPATPLGQWLLAKLALRKGAFPEAASLMREVVAKLPDDAATNYSDFNYLPKASASADLGGALLAQGKFTEALAAFMVGGCKADAAYVAERLLTTDELVRFVKENATLPDDVRASKPESDEVAAMHWEMMNDLMNLTGRRLIREDRNAEGRLLLGKDPRASFDAFRDLGAVGRDEKKPKKERAKALFDAACILEDGSSWCGTEDDFVRAEWGGYAPDNPQAIVQSRLTGKSKVVSEDGGNDPDNEKSVANFLPSSDAERKRLQGPAGRQRLKEYVRQAAALAVKAAELLPDNTEETADVLNQAGRWIQDLDNPGADKIYFQIEKRCPKTDIGKAVIAKHWFIEPDGP
ncbi:MAG: hypothetical protein QM755_17810 [Luteolibacter sp.]